ncbi:RNA polymerase I-specific transcription initiation factor RRN3 [Ischnura elegans]|uniref:RNA polymerase I-specific transcription initiation factor RRN3 n=1 Tax=Ischnura elegans TaxID=197161 RepID=UPI001ED87FF5|nr:RNA polymerase I-specific transcription initiation factor RRN3 [Ischnura elegans]
MSKTGILKTAGGASKPSNKVQFRIPIGLKSTLSDYVKGQDKRLYEETVSLLRDYDVVDDDLLQLLKEVRSVVSILDRRVKFFVHVFLLIPWAHRSGPVVEEYQKFLLDILTAHNYYIDISFEILVKTFRTVDPSASEDDPVPTAHERNVSTNVHKVLRDILRVIPLSSEILVEQCKTQYPYVRRPAREQELYLGNILTIMRYQPSLQLELLGIVISKMILLDVNSPFDEIETMEEEEDEKDVSSTAVDDLDATSTVTSLMGGPLIRRIGGTGMRHPLANTLDRKIVRFLAYTNSVCLKNRPAEEKEEIKRYYVESLEELQPAFLVDPEEMADSNQALTQSEDKVVDWVRCKCLYDDLKDVFSRLVLPTHGSHHVQFLMFYFAAGGIQDSKNQQWVKLASSYVSLLWEKASSPNSAPVERVAALNYLASFLARSKLLPISILKTSLTEMCHWIHSYIGRQEYTESGALTRECENRNHSVFNSACHALFYIIAFRHMFLSKTTQDIQFLQSLNLSRIVTAALNPLKTCPSNIAKRFSSVVASLQLAYCATVMEANARETIPIESNSTTLSTLPVLSSCFPFDRYALTRSDCFISPLFLQYQGSEEKESPDDECASEDEDGDHFLDESPYHVPRRVRDVSMSEVYGTSPGLMDLT